MKVQKRTKPLLIRRKNESLCSRLYTILSSMTARKTEDIAQLQKNYVLFGRSNNLARVLDVNKRDIHYELLEQKDEQKWDNNVIEQGITGVFWFSKYKRLHIKTNEMLPLFQIYSEEPKKVVFSSGAGTIVSFIREDPDLEDILKQGMIENPSVKNLKDLEKLTDWVCNSREYDKSALTPNLDYRYSLGKIWKSYGAVCRHFSAIEFALLILLGVKSKLVCTEKETVRELEKGHTFLEVPVKNKYNQEEPYVVDPTLNFVVPKNNLIKFLRDTKRETLFHQDYQEMKIYPRYKRELSIL